MASPTTDRRLGLVGNTAYKTPVSTIAIANITLSGEQTVNGLAVKALNISGFPDRVLCTAQTDATQNGFWDVSTAAWTRSIDANGNYDLTTGSQVYVAGGSSAGQIWALTTAAPITIGTTALTFQQNLTTGFLATLAASNGSSLIGFIQAGTGATARTMQAKVRELISSTDFTGRGSDNWGYGTNALLAVTPAGAGTGVQSIAIGTSALTAMTAGFGNTAVGHLALKTLTTPAYCSAFGIRALENADRTADVQLACTAIGAYSLNANTNGQYNVGVGYLSGTANTTGFFNVWVGTRSGEANIVGSSNTCVGFASLNAGTGSRNVAIGDHAAFTQTSGNDSVAIGYQALFANLTGSQSVAIGTNALATATGGPNVAMGYLAAQSLQTGVNNVAIGPTGVMATANGAASRNIAIGTNALTALTSNSDNTAIGHGTLAASINGQQTAVGSGALGALTNGGGTGSVAVGYLAGSNATTGANNIFIGASSGTDAVANISTTSNNIVMGNNAAANAFIKIAWTVTSDARDKTEHADLDRGLGFVMAMKPKSFRLMDRATQEPTSGVRFGFFAQDLLAIEAANAVLVDDSDPENLKLRESMVVPILVKAIQELKAEVDDLRKAA